MDIVTYILCKKYAKKYTDEQIQILSKGMTYKGSVESKEDLPLSGNTLGDLYTTSDLGQEFVWTLEADSGELSDWQELNKIDLSNFYTKVEVDAAIAAKSAEDREYVDQKVIPKIDDKVNEVINSKVFDADGGKIIDE